MLESIFSQGPFNTLVYEIIGDDDAPSYFKLDSRTGEVTINRDLRETDAEVFRVSSQENKGGNILNKITISPLLSKKTPPF